MLYVILGSLGTAIVGAIALRYTYKLGYSYGLTRAVNAVHEAQLRAFAEKETDVVSGEITLN